jgi:pimeloyl-ACP methyl ester carboxylesterase
MIGIKILLGLFLLLLIGNLLTYFLQYRFLFRPTLLPESTPFSFPFAHEEVFIDTEDGGKINGLWIKQADRKTNKGILFYFHGNADNLSRWGSVYTEFELFGYDLFIMDYRGFGKSRGKKNNRLLHRDAFLVYEKIAPTYQGFSIVLYGRSIGTGFATELASVVTPDFLILESPFSSIPDLFYAYYPFLPRWFIFHYRFDNKKMLRKTSCPVYIFHGNKDRIIPLSCALKLKPYLKPTDHFWVISGAGHNNLSGFPEFTEKRRHIFLP